MDDLTSIVALLPPISINSLSQQSPDVQTLVVSHLKNMLEYWEQNNVVLDPVQREVVVDSIVVTLVNNLNTFTQRFTEFTESVRARFAPGTDGGELPGGEGAAG